MLLERQRLLLTLLDVVGQPMRHMDFQKLLFLYTHECEITPRYDFVPYKFGAFSFTSYADKRKLIALGLLMDDEQHWVLTEAGRIIARRHSIEPVRVASFCQRHQQLRGTALVVEQYRRFPYYATRSEILDQLQLEQETLARIEAAKPKRGPAALVTIGYEGRSLENYLNELLRRAVTVLCDVRRNPVSRKYGFSKGTLSKASEGLDMRYEHLPELGIASDERRGLHTQADYEALFAWYRRKILPRQRATLERILLWLAAGERVALTCFERLPEHCHRHCVAEALEQMTSASFKTDHV